LGKDEEESFAQINHEVITLDGEPIMINDLSTGRFDIRVRTGPSYATAKLEARDQLTQMVTTNPALWQVIGDLIVENMDFPGADQIAERLRKAMDPNIVGEKDDEVPQPDPIAEFVQRLNLMGMELDVQKKAAEVEKINADADKSEAEAAAKNAEIGRKDVETETKVLTSLNGGPG
jgi:hypothetical protein